MVSLLLLTTVIGAGPPLPRGSVSREYFEARALFEKLWEPDEASPNGGDGIGPLYNELSCVGCHHQGGSGGAGGNEKNVTLLSASPGSATVGRAQAIYQGELEALHPGFRGRSSIVLHQHSTLPGDDGRLEEIRRYDFVQTRDDLLALGKSQRSTPALFGSGRINSIPDRVIIETEIRAFSDFPEIKGRVSRIRGGRIGKFGWKGQTASLDGFVMAACANELGLEVRGHHQPSLLSAREFDPTRLKLDLGDDECARLIRFVANLPVPALRPVGAASWGSEVFGSIGCAVCHAPSMGSVNGIYSDLLLHDMGDRMRASGGGYGGGSTVIDKDSGPKDVTSGEAGPTEWRTTPLWGVASSAPYLHDGRASTLNEAILLHGGEAAETTKRYIALSRDDRQALLAFLHSQVAPSLPGRADGKAESGPRRKRK